VAKKLCGLKDVAKQLGVHPATIVRWLEAGKVDVRKKKTTRGHYVFTASDVRKLQRFNGSIRTFD
jgi:predicted site-specific integrase-resolvase